MTSSGFHVNDRPYPECRLQCSESILALALHSVDRKTIDGIFAEPVDYTLSPCHEIDDMIALQRVLFASLKPSIAEKWLYLPVHVKSRLFDAALCSNKLPQGFIVVFICCVKSCDVSLSGITGS